MWRVTHGPFARFNTALYKIGYPPWGASVRRRLIAQLNVDLVIDCGANTGQYAAGLRNAGYFGRILSVEPGSEAFAQLETAARRDRRWECLRAAVYDEDGRVSLRVAEESPCNTLFNPLPSDDEIVPGVQTAFIEEVEALTLDTIVDRYASGAQRIWIKLDVEGAELRAVSGGKTALGRSVAVEAELGLVPIYENEPMFFETSKVLYEEGFFLCNTSGAFQDTQGTWIKIDGVFLRNEFRGKVRL